MVIEDSGGDVGVTKAVWARAAQGFALTGKISISKFRSYLSLSAAAIPLTDAGP
jgi:hypothetical protein